MKGLLSIPSIADLTRVYQRLQTTTEPATPDEIALWSQFARFDPRLAEQLVTHIAQNWRKIHPMEVNKTLLEITWPAALGVMLEHVPLLEKFDRVQLASFSNWKDLVMARISKSRNSSDEQFFIGLRAIGGKAMVEDAKFPLSLYRAWGFLGRDVLLNKWKAGRRTLVHPAARKVARDELLEKGRRFTVRDYREILRNEVSPRQAELDLMSDPRVRALGSTRGRYYVRRS